MLILKNNILKLTTDSFHKSIENLSVKILSENPKQFLKGDIIEKTFKVR